MATICPECGADWSDGATCENCFHQMLFWETEEPALGEVHHLAVLCYHLQHPSLMSRDGLAYQIKLLADFVEHGITPAQVQKNARFQVDSGKRAWKVTARPGDAGSYKKTPKWEITAVDTVAAGKSYYIESVRGWANSIHKTLASMAARPALDPD